MNIKFILTLLASLAASGLAAAGTNDLTTPLQRGLLEEEANHQLEAAIGDYKETIEQFDHERQLAATAIFRLGECYRKLGRTNEANAQYERIVREFSDQTQLAALSKASLPTGAGVVAAADLAASSLPPDEDKFLREVKESVQNSPDLLNHQLFVAAQIGYVSAAEFLIEHGADVNRSSCLVEAAGNGNKAMVQMLLNHGAKVDDREDDTAAGRTALYRAVEKGFMTVTRTLVAHGADVNEKNKNGGTPLRIAIDTGQFVAAEFLISNKAQIDPSVMNTELLGAAQNGDLSKAEFLLAHGVDANVGSPIVTAASHGHEPIVRLLLRHGAKVDSRGNGGRTALGWAVENGHLDVCHTLVEHGADVNAKGDQPNTPLILAVDRGNLAAAEFLITNKAQIDVRTDNGLTPLTMAIIKDQIEMVKLLLDNRADANLESEPPKESLSPLRWAISGNHPQTVQLLLEHGAKPNAVESDGDTALSDAIRQGNVDMVRALIEHGADVNFLDKQGRPPLAQLRAALAERHPGPQRAPSSLQQTGPQIEELLLKAGADPDYDRRRAIWTYGDDGTPKHEVFQCPSNSINHYTLLEFLAALYEVDVPKDSLDLKAPFNSRGMYAHGDAVVQFPEFARVTIHRLEGKREEVLHVNVAEILLSSDGSKDVALQAGDLVEIAKQEHKVADTWYGLSAAQITALHKCLLRTVKIISQGHTNELALLPLFADAALAEQMHFHVPQAPLNNMFPELPEILKGRKVDTVVRSFLLAEVVRDAKVLLNTWDLSRVRLARGGTKMTFDLTANPAPEVLLKDGDVIEIPELGASAPVTEAK